MLFGVNFDAVAINSINGSGRLETRQQDSPVIPGDNASKNSSSGDSVQLSDQARQGLASFRKETELSDEEKKRLEELKKRDREVRRHEQQHKAIGGQYVLGGATYEYERGPDGQLYAVGGEVKIDVSKESDPEATIRKMEIVQRAALAPADPSPQDRRVAAEASRIANQARAELAQQKAEESRENQQSVDEGSINAALPGSRSAVISSRDADFTDIKPIQNLFELFA